MSSSNNESLSNKVGNATGGTVGDETILHQATTLASHAVEYGKSVVGLGGHKAADSVQDATENKQGGVTLGGLVNESRDLTANVLHTVQGVVQGGAQQAKEAGAEGADKADAQAGGIIQTARDLAGKAIGVAENIIATGAKKVEEGVDQAKETGNKLANDASNTSTNDLKNKASNAVDSASKTVNDTAADAKKKTDQVASDAQKKANA